MAGVRLWNPEMQSMPRADLERLQLQRIQKQVLYVYHNSPFYRRLYDRKGVKPDKIRSLADFREQIPIVRKDDLRAYQLETGDPFSGLRCVPMAQLAHFWSSSGTTGLPTLGAYTLNDMRVAAEYLTRSYWGAGYRPGMRVATINMNWHWVMVPLIGAYRRLGLKPIMFDFAHASFAPRFARWLEYFQPEAFAGITTELMALIPSALRNAGKDPATVLSSCRLLTPMGEAITTQAMANARLNWGGATIKQGAGPGESYAWIFEGECDHPGGHIWTDIGYIEVVDPDTDEVLPPSQRGELVATNLLVDGVPYIRFGTEDLVDLSDEPCAGGITHPHGNVVGRTGWRAMVQGRTFIPWDVEVILQRHRETELAQFCIVKYAEQMDTLRLNIAYDPVATHNPEELRARLVREIHSALDVPAEIQWIKEEELPRPVPHKLTKFVDVCKRK